MTHTRAITAQRTPSAAATAAQCGKLSGKVWGYGIEGPGMWAASPFIARYEKLGCDAILG